MSFISLDEIDRLPLPDPSRVRLVIAPTVSEVQAALHNQATDSNGHLRYVAVNYDRLPPSRFLIDEILEHLANLALAFFPNWYGDLAPLSEIDGSLSRFVSLLGDQASETGLLKRGVLIPWLQAASTLCHRGQPPLPRGFTGSVHVAQLAFAIDRSPLLIALILHDANPEAGALLGLARTSEWLARHTGARVVVAVPDRLNFAAELDSINFDPVHVSTSQNGVERPTGNRSRVASSPLIGLPHPLSRGEQMLAQRLSRDDMLAGLFQFNIRVETRNGNHYLVDLVWTVGRIVVEVDGYEFHSDRAAFSNDRRRDYELLVSGYLVLRLPHDEVVEDVDLAVDKIRGAVHYRRANGLPECENRK